MRIDYIHCDNCTRRFDVVAQAEPTADGGELQFFVCPHCQTRYDYAIISPTGLRLRAEIHALREQFRNGGWTRELGIRYFELVNEYADHTAPAPPADGRIAFAPPASSAV